MDSGSSAAPGEVPPSSVPPLLPRTRRLPVALIVGLILISVIGLCVGGFFLARWLERRQPGAAVVLQFDLASVVAEQRADAWRGILRAVGRRAEALGGCRVDEVGPGRIRVRFFRRNAAEIADAGPFLARRMTLEFRLVHRFLTPETAPAGQVPPGYAAMTLEQKDRGGRAQTYRYFVKESPELTGEGVRDAFAVMDEFGRFKIALRFTSDGARRLAEVTRAIAQENQRTSTRGQLAIVLGGKLNSAPTVMEEISGGSAEITGTFTQREAIELAAMLSDSLPLSATFTLENEDGSKADLPALPRASR